MSRVGIIANPASGKDIRRVVSHATVFSNHEKSDMIKRLILGMDSVGVDEIWIMPDSSGLGMRALDALNHNRLASKVILMDFEIWGSQDDSIRAAQRMKDGGVDCIVTLGGDGTNRVVSKTCGPVPLFPLSTGTNNVFPLMNEGTTAGIAAGLLARKLVDGEKVLSHAKKLTLLENGRENDMALIDSVVVEDSFVGSRALWELKNVRHVFLTLAEPGSIGVSSIGAVLQPVGRRDRFGLWIELGPGGKVFKAPIAPGLIRHVPVRTWRVLQPGERIPLDLPSTAVIALDGEREVEVYPRAHFEMVLGMDGPRVADIGMILREATEKGLFRVEDTPFAGQDSRR